MIVKEIIVSACDNELYLLASTPRGSAELLHYKSGYNKPVKVQIFPGAILHPELEYHLTMIGINWSGDCSFEVILETDQGPQKFGHSGSCPIGVAWKETVKMRVTTP